MDTATTQIDGTVLVPRLIEQVKTAWATQNKAVSGFFSKYDDETYLKEIAPGRNTAVYLLGHLIAANDSMIPMFGLGERLYPEMHELYLASPDRKNYTASAVAELKSRWEKLNATLAGHFDTITAESWLDRHNNVSAEDFAKEPHRNKLNVLIGRTIHQSNHAGQLLLLSGENS